MKILFVEPHESSLFSFRKELLDAIISKKHEVVLCIEKTNKIEQAYGKIIKIVDVPMNLKSTSLVANLKLKAKYKKIIKEEKPDLIISYKIKPNIFCGFYSKKIPMIANITGLGNAFKKKNLLSEIAVFLYKKSFKNVDYVFFQNRSGLDFFNNNKIPINNFSIIPGSGVNTDKFFAKPVDRREDCINFLFASRAIEEKGFNLLVEAIPFILNEFTKVRFNFLSAEEDLFANKEFSLLYEKNKDRINVLKRTDEMQTVYSQNDFLVSPSYYKEGISNVLLESLSCGRPIITTIDNPGCMEVLMDGKNGIGVVSNNLNSLISALKKASSMSKAEIDSMGKIGREFVLKNFNREIVVAKYLDTIDEIIMQKEAKH